MTQPETEENPYLRDVEPDLIPRQKVSIRLPPDLIIDIDEVVRELNENDDGLRADRTSVLEAAARLYLSGREK